jgi:hypothetical protein
LLVLFLLAAQPCRTAVAGPTTRQETIVDNPLDPGQQVAAGQGDPTVIDGPRRSLAGPSGPTTASFPLLAFAFTLFRFVFAR